MRDNTRETIEKVIVRALTIVTPEATDIEQYVKNLCDNIEDEEDDPVGVVHQSFMSKYTQEQVDDLMATISLLLTGVPDEVVALFLKVMGNDSVEFFESLTEEQRTDVAAVMILAKIMDQVSGKAEEPHMPCTCTKCMKKAPEA